MKNHLHSHHNEAWTGTPSTTTRPVAQEGRLTQERNPALDSQHTPLLTRLRSFIESKSTGGVEASDITLAWSTPTASAIPSGAMEVFSRVLGEVFACNSPGFPIGAAVSFLTKGCLARLLQIDILFFPEHCDLVNALVTKKAQSDATLWNGKSRKFAVMQAKLKGPTTVKIQKIVENQVHCDALSSIQKSLPIKLTDRHEVETHKFDAFYECPAMLVLQGSSLQVFISHQGIPGSVVKDILLGKTDTSHFAELAVISHKKQKRFSLSLQTDVNVVLNVIDALASRVN